MDRDGTDRPIVRCAGLGPFADAVREETYPARAYELGPHCAARSSPITDAREVALGSLRDCA